METYLFLPLILWLIVIMVIIFKKDMEFSFKILPIFFLLIFIFITWNEVSSILTENKIQTSTFWLKSIYNTMHLFFYSLPFLWITNLILYFFVEKEAGKKILILNVSFSFMTMIIYGLLVLEKFKP